MSAARRPVFLLGVGAHKAGTSFLHRGALAGHPGVALSHPKEMHVFDAHFMPGSSGQFHRRRCTALAAKLSTEPRDPARATRRAALIAALESEARDITGAPRELLDAEATDPAPARQPAVAALLEHVRMHYDLGLYAAHFRNRVRGHALTGDITPAYQMLEAVHFAEIRDLLAPDFDLRVVFLMRDPVERIFSAMRMDDRNANEKKHLAHERFARTFSEDKHRRRTEYHRLIPALESVFAPEELYYAFYENLFGPEEFGRLTAFLGLEGVDPDFGTRVNASPTLGALPAEAVAAARAFYAPVYDFCMARFGTERVRALWPHA